MTAPLRRFMVRIAIGWLTATALADPAAACPCVRPGPPCQEFWNATAVFVGRVESLARASPDSVSVTFKVQEWFLGTRHQTVTLRTPAGAAACAYPFRSGREYLVYAVSVAGTSDLTTSLCSRTQLVERASADLEYARSLSSDSPPAARVFGRVVLRNRDLARRRDRDRPLSGATVSVLGSESVLQITADTMGAFSLSGLVAGRYAASVRSVRGDAGVIVPGDFELKDARACMEVEAVVHAAATVRGRVVDASGRAIPGLTIDLTVPDGLDRNPHAERVRALTRGDGTFELRGVPEGRFIVGINTTRESTPRLIYPGVDAVRAATVVAVRAGDAIDLHDFVIPANISFAAIQGVVREATGVPAVGARVFLAGPNVGDHIVGEPAITDEFGQFVLSAPAGQQYRLFAERSRPGSAGSRVDATDVLTVTASLERAVQKLTLRALH
jgi:hypothetical protein